VSENLWQWTASDITHAIRARRVSSVEVLESVLQRVQQINPRINAIVDLMIEDALATAERADEAVRRSEPLGPLHGVPVTVKINVDFAGRATTNGVVAFKDLIAPLDSAPVANLRKAGAIIFGRTNTPAFSHRAFTDNDLHGRTLNPWDPTRTPGGSSGGAAAAVASGLRLGLQALEMDDHADPWAFAAPARESAQSAPTRIALVCAVPGTKADREVTAALRQAAKLLEDAGCHVEEITPPDFVELATMFWKLLMTEERAASANEVASSTKAILLYGDEAVKRVRSGNMAYAGEYDFTGYVHALTRRTVILRRWRRFLRDYPLLLMPVSWVLPFPIDYDQGGHDAVRHTIETCHPLLAISTLGLPSLAVPTSFANGVPVGVQLVADRFQEERLLQAADIIQAGCPMSRPS